MKPFAYRVTDAPLASAELRILAFSLHETMPSGMVHRPQGLNHHLLVVLHTECAVREHGVLHLYPPQSLVLWEPDIGQDFGNAAASWDYSWLACDGPFLPTMCDTLALPRNTVIALPSPACLDHFLHCLQWIFAQYLRPDPVLVRNQLHNLLLEVAQQFASPGDANRLPSWAIAIKQYLEVNYALPITLEHLTELAHLSQTHFIRKFREVFSVSPLAYLTAIRLQVARELLLNENLSIAEIASRSGYNHFGHFSTIFRRYYGVCPREMRKGISGEAGQQRRTEERRSRELARWLREGWQVALDADFTGASEFPPCCTALGWKSFRPLGHRSPHGRGEGRAAAAHPQAGLDRPDL